MALPLGRGVGRIRTPALIRDYLTGQGAFAEDPPEELSQRLSEGDYVAHIHQRVKQYIRLLSKEERFKYQWPRRHSFGARINDLLTLGLLRLVKRRLRKSNHKSVALDAWALLGGFAKTVAQQVLRQLLSKCSGTVAQLREH